LLVGTALFCLFPIIVAFSAVIFPSLRWVYLDRGGRILPARLAQIPFEAKNKPFFSAHFNCHSFHPTKQHSRKFPNVIQESMKEHYFFAIILSERTNKGRNPEKTGHISIYTMKPMLCRGKTGIFYPASSENFLM
jgi:hypothetical protein